MITVFSFHHWFIQQFSIELSMSVRLDIIVKADCLLFLPPDAIMSAST